MFMTHIFNFIHNYSKTYINHAILSCNNKINIISHLILYIFGDFNFPVKYNSIFHQQTQKKYMYENKL